MKNALVWLVLAGMFVASVAEAAGPLRRFGSRLRGKSCPGGQCSTVR